MKSSVRLIFAFATATLFIVAGCSALVGFPTRSLDEPDADADIDARADAGPITDASPSVDSATDATIDPFAALDAGVACPPEAIACDDFDDLSYWGPYDAGDGGTIATDANAPGAPNAVLEVSSTGGRVYVERSFQSSTTYQGFSFQVFVPEGQSESFAFAEIEDGTQTLDVFANGNVEVNGTDAADAATVPQGSWTTVAISLMPPDGGQGSVLTVTVGGSSSTQPLTTWQLPTLAPYPVLRLGALSTAPSSEATVFFDNVVFESKAKKQPSATDYAWPYDPTANQPGSTTFVQECADSMTGYCVSGLGNYCMELDTADSGLNLEQCDGGSTQRFNVTPTKEGVPLYQIRPATGFGAKCLEVDAAAACDGNPPAFCAYVTYCEGNASGNAPGVDQTWTLGRFDDGSYAVEWVPPDAADLGACSSGHYCLGPVNDNAAETTGIVVACCETSNSMYGDHIRLAELQAGLDAAPFDASSP